MTLRYFVLLSLASLVHAASVDAAEPDEVVFNRDIRPILSNHCYACHGPDEGQRQAGLRLDLEEHAKTSHAIVPGDVESSELANRIASSDEGLRMPPPDANKDLTQEQISLLRKWIEQGAKWQPHWSQIPPKRMSAPAAADGAFPQAKPQGAVDRFIQARLVKEDLQPSAPANRRTLLRRLSFDLIGLPPSAVEIDAFEKDASPDAYLRQVDRFLASPQYGERMAIKWLDLVRYADTNGIHGDNHREHWPFREYVVDAFNHNKPFDQFTVEQLAGDLLDGGREALIASGYNRLNMTTREGGAQAKEYRTKYAADRVRNVSTVWLGATLGCAQCHDHKFDPFTIKDFYSMAAFFADIQETAVGAQSPTKIPTSHQTARLNEFDRRMAPLREKLSTQTPRLDQAQAKWERELESHTVEWTTLTPLSASAQSGTTLKIEQDGVVTASGEKPQKDVYTLTFRPEHDGATALRIETLPDDSLPAKGAGRARNGNFVVTEVKLTVGGKQIRFSSSTADHAQDGWPAEGAADGKANTGWAVLPQIDQPHELVLQAESDLAADAEWVVEIHQNHGKQHVLGKLRASVTTTPRPVRAGGEVAPESVAKILSIAGDERNEKQRRELSEYFRSITPLLAETREQLAQLEKEKKAFEASIPAMLVSVSSEPREVRILPRGNWLDDSGPVVDPAVPGFMDRLEVDGRASRLDLARWLVSTDNPATGRVFVNRLWSQFFGRGIVTSLDDFGAQGSWPTHPELLDWLAWEFIGSGWDIKHVARLIVSSHAYRQTSQADAIQKERDPYNALLARQGRFRLPAEMVRDNALAVSGLLSLKMGGPSVKPYQPSGYWAHLNFPRRQWQHDQGESLYRRGLYTYWCRTFLHPAMLAFDAPSREECAVDRTQSNTPQQALVLLNDPAFVEAARVFAERIVHEGGKDAAARLEFAFDKTLGRPPKPKEAALLIELVARHRRQYQEDPSQAHQLLSVGERPAPEGDLAEIAAWTSAARVIFNLHETIMRY